MEQPPVTNEQRPDSFDDYDRWLFDQKITHTLRFEHRQIQLIGLIGVIIALLTPTFSFDELLSGILIGILLVGFLALIAIYLKFSWPRKIKDRLEPSYVMKPTPELYSSVISELNSTLAMKAKWMRGSHFIFFFVILAILAYQVISSI